jgi:hypothetical protein
LNYPDDFRQVETRVDLQYMSIFQFSKVLRIEMLFLSMFFFAHLGPTTRKRERLAVAPVGKGHPIGCGNWAPENPMACSSFSPFNYIYI